mmetsp:Transcript_4956/g.14071  ORF Transcript_4956/g.14071 Transcript_4956/m.14071 type:complete len:235 (+) Transcript_4956:57-761(+)
MVDPNAGEHSIETDAVELVANVLNFLDSGYCVIGRNIPPRRVLRSYAAGVVPPFLGLAKVVVAIAHHEDAAARHVGLLLDVAQDVGGGQLSILHQQIEPHLRQLCLQIVHPPRRGIVGLRVGGVRYGQEGNLHRPVGKVHQEVAGARGGQPLAPGGPHRLGRRDLPRRPMSRGVASFERILLLRLGVLDAGEATVELLAQFVRIFGSGIVYGWGLGTCCGCFHCWSGSGGRRRL